MISLIDMLKIGILAGAAIIIAGAVRAERWITLGTAALDGEMITYAVDQAWHGGSGLMRTSHWQIVYVNARAGQARDYRFIDQVDCQHEMRAPLVIERYDDDGNLLGRKEYAATERRWTSIASDDVDARADGLFCIDGPVSKK